VQTPEKGAGSKTGIRTKSPTRGFPWGHFFIKGLSTGPSQHPKRVQTPEKGAGTRKGCRFQNRDSNKVPHQGIPVVAFFILKAQS
jgi:hypothetical protein